jgi:hypothetical protein
MEKQLEIFIKEQIDKYLLKGKKSESKVFQRILDQFVDLVVNNLE